jgi:hypothetical protein
MVTAFKLQAKITFFSNMHCKSYTIIILNKIKLQKSTATSGLYSTIKK